MARIRTIKPEFPQSESMGNVSREARLLFILLWPICDDYGRTRAASRMLASTLFPYDDDAKGLIDGWLDELEREGCIRRYTVNGSTYLEVCNWLNHQKIDRPSKPQFPEPSANTREDSRIFVLGKEGKGKEGSGEDLEPADAGLSAAEPTDLPTDASGEQPKPGRPPCPHERIIALYHEILPELRRVREWNETRRRLLQRRWSEQPERQSLDWWRDFFGYVRQSRFLMGRVTGRDGRSFDCDLEWLVRPANFAKVIEGKYEDQAA